MPAKVPSVVATSDLYLSISGLKQDVTLLYTRPHKRQQWGEGDALAKLLVHVTTGPDDQTKTALAFLIAKTALAEGHEVKLFLAGEAVRLLDPRYLDSVEGQGTGKLREHYDAIDASGGRFYLSLLSSKARGYDDSLIADKPAEFAMPETLVKLIMETDKSVVY